LRALARVVLGAGACRAVGAEDSVMVCLRFERGGG
jgi:hypothetical protein